MLSKKNKTPELTRGQKTAQDFVNVKSISDNMLFTKDGYVFMYISVTPIIRDLMTENEQMSLCNNLISELSSLTKPWRFFNLQKPVDVSNVVSELTTLKRSEEISDARKRLLSLEIAYLDKEATNNTTAECEYFISVWDKINEADTLRLYVQDIINKINEAGGNSGMRAEIVNYKGIINICSFYTNPAVSTMEHDDYYPDIMPPIVRLREGGGM